jgi:ubiquinone biosynthesis protein Coq4
MPDTLLPLFSKQETADCRKMAYPSLGITRWVKLLKAGLKTMRLYSVDNRKRGKSKYFSGWRMKLKCK